jgi:hypothetical protein
MKDNNKPKTNLKDKNSEHQQQNENVKLEFNTLAIQAGYSDRATNEIWKWYHISKR